MLKSRHWEPFGYVEELFKLDGHKYSNVLNHMLYHLTKPLRFTAKWEVKCCPWHDLFFPGVSNDIRFFIYSLMMLAPKQTFIIETRVPEEAERWYAVTTKTLMPANYLPPIPERMYDFIFDSWGYNKPPLLTYSVCLSNIPYKDNFKYIECDGGAGYWEWQDVNGACLWQWPPKNVKVILETES